LLDLDYLLVKECCIVPVHVELARYMTCRKLLLHGAEVCVLSVAVVRFLAMNLCFLCEKEMVEVYLVDQEFLLEIV